MKKICTFLLITAVAASLAACGGVVENKPANIANANTAKPAPAAPTADALLAMEKAANEAYAKGDSAYFDGMLSDKMIMSMGKDHMSKAGVVAMIKTAKCELTDGVKLSDPQMSKIDNDTYAFAYKNESAGKCLENGKMVEQKPMRASTIWVRNGEKWQAAWHGETAIMEPKGDMKKDEAKKEEPKKDEAKKDAMKTDEAKKDVAKKEEPKKEEMKKEEAKKEAPMKDDAKKDVAKKDDKMAANSAAAPAEAPKPDANTEALTKLHQSGWEAWRDKDAAKLTSLLAGTFAVVGPMGNWIGSRDEAVKFWTSEDCKDVKNVKVSDGFASALSPTIELFTLKGTADGTCGGQKNGALWQSTVYVKEGNDWKLAFMAESPAK